MAGVLVLLNKIQFNLGAGGRRQGDPAATIR
jgi:hypothetical protein